MKTHRIQIYAGAALALFLSSGLPGASARAAGALPGLKNPSIRVLVDEDNPIPRSGTIGWGLSMFRVEAGLEADLSTVNERLQDALRTGFKTKGFGHVEKNPDYLVSFALAAGAEIDEAELNRTYGDILALPAPGTNAVGSLAYKRGVLIVDVVDRKAKRLLWRGAIMAEIDMNWDKNLKQVRCDAAVGELMTFFPRPPKSLRVDQEETRKEMP